MAQGQRLIVLGEKGKVRRNPFKGKNRHHDDTTLRICDFSSENTACLMDLFPYTRPIPLRKYPITVGTGDRLGLATPGHLRAVRKFQVRPVLAQESVRENKQTGRNFFEVVRDAAWAVFQENYQEGYGADGDHLKAFDEIQEALDAGDSMITLDLTEKLNPSAFTDSREEIGSKLRKRDRGRRIKGPFPSLSEQGSFTSRVRTENSPSNSMRKVSNEMPSSSIRQSISRRRPINLSNPG